MIIDPKSKTVTINTEDMISILGQIDRLNSVVSHLLNSLKQHPDLFPKLADNEKNSDLYNQFDEASYELLMDYPELDYFHNFGHLQS